MVLCQCLARVFLLSPFLSICSGLPLLSVAESGLSMRRLVVLIVVATALAVAGSLGFLNAQGADHPFQTTWCSSPVIIPLATADANETVPADGVVTARGAQAVLSSRGPAIRMTEPGSRAQITFGQTLFHTQWLFGSVDEGDVIRTDAFIGDARQSVEASSARGALVVSDEQSTLGLTSESREMPRSTGEIDVFVGATEVLFTNEGETPVELIAAIGCPALHVETEVLSAPTWDAESQRFIAEHEVTFNNELANARTRALRSQFDTAANTAVEDLSIDLSVAAGGFRSAEIVSLDLSRELDRRQNVEFDGVNSTGVLELPLRLSDNDEQKIRFSVSYEPNFDDPSWSEGVGVPAPTLTLRGRVDDVQVGVSAVLRPTGPELDASTSPSLLVAPSPGLILEHEYVDDPESTVDGDVILSERIVVSNSGDTEVTELVLTYAVADMYGPGTAITEISGTASNGCASDSFSTSFDGSAQPVIAFDPTGLGVGQSCTVDLLANVRPGVVPTSNGESYEGAIIATARSGAREVRDAMTVQSTIEQDARLTVDLDEVEVTNLEDGRYQFDGAVTLNNEGDQNLSEVAARIDLVAAVGEEGNPVTAFVTAIEGDPFCAGLGAPGDSVTGAVLTAGNALRPNLECTIEFSLIARPGTVLDGWSLTAGAQAVSPRGIAIEVTPSTSDFEIEESPSIASTITTDSVVNNADGSYTVELITEVTNTGDTPLTSITVEDTGATVFGSRVIAAARIGDSCSAVEPGEPLRAASQPEGPYSCSVTEQYVVAPGAQLDEWMIETNSEGRSTSGVIVSTSAELDDEITFTERPSVTSSVELTSIEKVDNSSVRIGLLAVVTNTGDIEVRSLGASLDLQEALQGADFTIEGIGADGATVSSDFNGNSNPRLLTGNDELARDATAEIRLVVLAQTGSNSGPFDFELGVEATSPSTAELDVDIASVDRIVPVVQVIDRALLSTNNNDGTYSVEHVVTARNSGEIDVPRIDVVTTFNAVFDDFVVGEVETSSNCGSAVAAGQTCTSTRTATLRPGSAIGPYEVEVNIASADSDQLVALVMPEPQDVLFDARANAPLRFEERPSIDIDTVVSDAVNNGDGTYTLELEASVTNSGDVPLYRTGVSDLAAGFGEAAIVNDLDTDTCQAVSFASPLGPLQTCSRSQTVIVRPSTDLGPWANEARVTAESPAFAQVLRDTDFDSVTFAETVEIEASSTLRLESNNGNGTYNVIHELVVTNESNVPIVSVNASDVGAAFGDAREGQDVVVDSCTGVSLSEPLPPGQECRVELNQLLRTGADLGPFELESVVSGSSPSGEQSRVEVTTNSLQLNEAPRLSLSNEVVSVESVDDDTFRIVTDLFIENDGDVLVRDLEVELELAELFPDSVFRIDGVISNDLVINEAFAAGESTNMLAEGQSIVVDGLATITVILSIEPAGEVGPFVGELRATGVSPAEADVAAVINAQIDLPSIAVAVVAQSVDNNRDGSYTVITSYELTNDGSTPLEFVRLIEDVGAIYGGTNVSTQSVESADIAVVDLNEPRGNDVLEWGAMLETGGSATVTTTVLVEPGNVLGPFVPTGDVTAVSPTGTTVSSNAFSTEEIEFVEQPALRVSQRLLQRPAWNGSGTFDVSFAIDVVNDGDVELRSLQVRQDLLNALGPNASIRVREVRSDELAANTNFDGRGQLPSAVGEEAEPTQQRRDFGDTRLLLGWDTLAAGETATIELDLTITPEERGVYSTQVNVSALTPAGTGLGAGGDDSIEANTLTRLSVQGEIGVAKQTIGEPSVRPDGSVSVTYEILVENAGPFPLSNVEVHDQLSQAFGVGSTFVTSQVRIEPNSPCVGSASLSYDGGTIDPVLISGVELEPGQQCRIQYDAVVIPSIALPGPYRSSAFAIASDPFSGTVIDDSTDGTNIDPDGNQEPGDNDIATSVRVTAPAPTGSIAVEALDSSALDSGGWYEFGYRISVTNDGLIDIDTTRLIGALDDEWSVPFEVVSISSDDLVVNDGFDGEGNDNLLQRRNRLRAGDTAVIDLRIRAARDRDDSALVAGFVFRGESVTGEQIEVELESPVEALAPGASLGTAWLDTLTTEEKRLLALGSGAILLFVALFVRSNIVRARRFRRKRASEKAEQLAREELFVDLRESDEARRRVRAHAPDIDLVEGGTDGEIVEHYSPRRRRGRRPVEKSADKADKKASN